MANIATSAHRLALIGAGLVLVGMLTGFVLGQLANPRMGLSSHLAAVSGGTLLLALAGVWSHLRLGPRAERWAAGLLAYAMVANWLATLLAAIWSAGAETMPIAAGGRQASAMQEGLITALLVSLSIAVVIALVLVIMGMLRGRRPD